jgi:hypothetical protein
MFPTASAQVNESRASLPGTKLPGGKAAMNPLSNMLPINQYRLRVWREREMDDPVWVGDYPADRVQAVGVEPFLGKEVTPRLIAQGVRGDVTLIVATVSPNGQVSERHRLTVACVPPAQAVPAFMPAMPAASAPSESGEMAELLAHYKRLQHEQMSTQRPAAPVQAAHSPEMEEMKRIVLQLSGSVQELAKRVEQREVVPRLGYEDGPPQLDTLALLREVMAMTKQAPPPPPPPQMGLGDMLNQIAQVKALFQPQQVNIDVSPLEERIEQLQSQLQAQSKKDDMVEFAEKFKAMKEVFSQVGGETGAAQPTGLGAAFSSLVSKVVENPAPVAEAVERILGAATAMKQSQAGNVASNQHNPSSPQKQRSEEVV